MTDAVISAMPQILIKIQEDMAAFRESMESRIDLVDNRLGRLEEINKKQRRDSAGMLVMMRATAGAFDERVSDVEERLATQERLKS